MFYTSMTNQQKRIYKYVPSHIIILHQHVSVSHVTIIRGLVTTIKINTFFHART